MTTGHPPTGRAIIGVKRIRIIATGNTNTRITGSRCISRRTPIARSLSRSISISVSRSIPITGSLSRSISASVSRSISVTGSLSRSVSIGVGRCITVTGSLSRSISASVSRSVPISRSRSAARCVSVSAGITLIVAGNNVGDAYVGRSVNAGHTRESFRAIVRGSVAAGVGRAGVRTLIRAVV